MARTPRVEMGLVLVQPERKHTVFLTGICGVEHHRGPLTLDKQETQH